MTMNTAWGCSEHDHAWKSGETLIRTLVDVAGKGGNYLLNIGPRADGSVPEDSARALRAIGAWLKTNGESVYGTRAGLDAPLPWGRSTTKGTTLYLHVFAWPGDRRLLVPGLDVPVRSARLLAGGALAAGRTGRGLIVRVPSRAPDSPVSVIAFDLERPLGPGR